MNPTFGERIDEILDRLADTIAHACGEADGRVDSQGIMAYAKAIILLEHYGRVEIESIAGPRVIGRFTDSIH